MKTAVFCFGRFNPITMGHITLIDLAAKYAASEEASFYVFPSRTTDKHPKTKPLDPSRMRNPLSFSTRYAVLTGMLPTVNIIDDPDVKSPQQVTEYLKLRNYTKVIFAVGSDRVEEFEARWLPYALDDFMEASVEGIVNRDSTSDDISGMSGTKARQAALSGDINQFRFTTGLPELLSDSLYYEVRREMKLDGSEGQPIQDPIISSERV